MTSSKWSRTQTCKYAYLSLRRTIRLRRSRCAANRKPGQVQAGQKRHSRTDAGGGCQLLLFPATNHNKARPPSSRSPPILVNPSNTCQGFGLASFWIRKIMLNICVNPTFPHVAGRYWQVQRRWSGVIAVVRKIVMAGVSRAEFGIGGSGGPSVGAL